ncbi:serine/threonine-protein phosphatase [Desulfococcaceae bacterium HSG8]|nr:serine/threonine-protein phosphatase [Desulfococcaceae bacterium HSG8]
MKKLIQQILPSGKRVLCAFGSSDKGSFRDENQDNFLILQPEDGRSYAYSLMEEEFQRLEGNWPETHIRVAVADGMGGHEGGREISQAAVTELMNIDPQLTPEAMRFAILELHKLLQSQFSSKGERNPGTTLVMADVEVKSGKGIMLNIGDSRALFLQKNQWRQLTLDHHAFEFSWRDGEFDRDTYEAKLEAGDHRIVQALGYGSMGIIRNEEGYKPFRFDPNIRLDLKADLPPDLSDNTDVFTFHLSHGDMLMLASDGLWRADPEASWRDIPPEQLFSQDGVDKLVHSSAVRPEADDNITVILCGFM